MKIDFEMLRTMEASGASAKLVIDVLEGQFKREEAKKLDKRPKDAERIRLKRAATKGDTVTTSSDMMRHDATSSDNVVVSDPFDDFMKLYPKRDGTNPKIPARKVYLAHLKSGIEAKDMNAGAKRFADEARRRGEYGTPFVPQAVKWLRQQQWIDHEPQLEVSAGGFHAEPDSTELAAWEEYRMATEGKSWPRDKLGGWTFPTQWPPGYAPSAERAAHETTQ